MDTEMTPAMAEAARAMLTDLIDNIDKPTGICFQCKQPVQRKEQQGRYVVMFPCGHRYHGQLPQKLRTHRRI